MKIMPLNIQVPDNFDVTSEAQARSRWLLMEALAHYVQEHPRGMTPQDRVLAQDLLVEWNSYTLPVAKTAG